MNKMVPEQIRALFVAEATRKFARNVADFRSLQMLIGETGGEFRNDHGAIRCADPALTLLFERAAGVLGLRRELSYRFPAKKLVSFDLQVVGEDASQFKIFVSEVELSAFPPAVAELIRADCAAQAAHVDHTPLRELIDRAERFGGLAEEDAQAFVEHLVHRLMHRNGPPMSRATLEAVAAVSGEAASALALGPDFNHLTIDVRAAGFDGIDAMVEAMRARGFAMLPQIQGAVGSALRQTATMAATQATPVIEADGSVGLAPTERQFVEIIERGQARNPWGALQWTQDGRPLVFRNFLAANAERIFDAASTRLVTGAADSC